MNKYYFLVTLILLCWSESPAQLKPDFNEVKKFFIENSEKTMIPRDYLVGLEEPLFKFVYSDNLCFVHVSYKGYFSECTMKASAIAICQLQKGKWILKKVIPFYYNFSKTDFSGKLFLSVNEFCEPNGICNTYTELCEFDAETFDFIPIKKYQGFDRYLNYYSKFLIQGKSHEQFIGDSVISRYELSNFIFKGKENNSFDLQRKISLLEGVRDSLITKTTIYKSKIIFKYN